MRPKPIYSVRDALGRELWWTASQRRNDLRHLKAVCDALNAMHAQGEHVRLVIPSAPGLPYAAECAQPNALSAHSFPVAVWKCSEVKPRKPAERAP